MSKYTDLRGQNILFISDTHFPYHHPDTFKFLSAVKRKYGCTAYRHVGDIVDNHYPSYHEIEPGTYDGETELRLARQSVHTLYELFPELVISEGNHDALPLRKAKTAKIPEAHIRNYNDVFNVPDSWRWVRQELMRTDAGDTLLTHSVGSNARSNATRLSLNSVQGHHHSEFGVFWYADNASLRWHMSTGCLINISSPAFNYARGAVLRRPVLGCGVIVNGSPTCVPMVLNSKGKWVGF